MTPARPPFLSVEVWGAWLSQPEMKRVPFLLPIDRSLLPRPAESLVVESEVF